MCVLVWLERHVEELICCSCLVLIAVSVFLQVVARYVFGGALPWTEEIATMAMVWAVYMGAALCVRERFHIRILFAVTALPERLGKIVIIVADLLFAFFCLFMIKASLAYLAVHWRLPEHSPSLGINQIYPQSILVIGYALMLLRLAQLYWNWRQKGGKGLPGIRPEDTETIPHSLDPDAKLSEPNT